jgi:pimeloyl-ACP methyl ester carboxylesterase
MQQNISNFIIAVLIGPSLNYSAEKKQDLRERAEWARSSGMSVVAARLARSSLSAHSLSTNFLAETFVEQSVANTLQEGYVLACLALAQDPGPDYSRISPRRTVVINGVEDQVITKVHVGFAKSAIANTEVIWMDAVGHWPMLEDVPAMGSTFADCLAPSYQDRDQPILMCYSN